MQPATTQSEIATLLFVEWVQLLAEQHLSLHQHGSGNTAEGNRTYNFGDPRTKYFELVQSSRGEWSIKTAKQLDKRKISQLMAEASARTSAGDLGDDIVYQTTMNVAGFSINPVAMSISLVCLETRY
jgi:hypothetical protein